MIRQSRDLGHPLACDYGHSMNPRHSRGRRGSFGEGQFAQS
jgi:hypothetical protein